MLDPGDKKPAQVGPKLISVLNLLFHALNLEEAAAAAGSEKKAPAKKSAEAKDMRVTTFSQPVYSFLLLLGQDDFAKQLTLIAGKSKEASQHFSALAHKFSRQSKFLITLARQAPDLQEVKEEEEPGPAKKDRKKAAAEPAKKPEKEDRKKAAAEPAKKPEKEDRKKAAAEPAKKPEKEDRKQGAAGPAKKPEEEAGPRMSTIVSVNFSS